MPPLDWSGAEQDDADLGAAIRSAEISASSTPGGFNASSVLGAVSGAASTVTGLIRTLYDARASVVNAQNTAAIQDARGQAAISAELIRARQLAAQAATPPITIAGMSLQSLMPLLVIGAGALLWKRLK